ncbi:MAG: dTDP-4-dehydrorhamnose reductase [Thermodesulfobacteriota bacterium]
MQHDNPPTAVVFGGRRGLLGQAVTRKWTQEGWRVHALGREDVDLDSQEALRATLHSYHPDVVVNAIAYTHVDGAETDVANARNINQGFPCRLGRSLPNRETALIHYSTDFVFGGEKQTPYTPDDPTRPCNVYGQTKLEGEKALLQQGLPRLYIIRTAWLFGPGKANFVTTMRRLAATHPRLRVIHDQLGSPTYTLDLAGYTLHLLHKAPPGVYHLANSGRASWCELASEALNLFGSSCPVEAITAAEYPQTAPRPHYSVLDCEAFTAATGIKPRPWPQALRDYVYLVMEDDGA